jgi:hypothetical protein
VTADSSAPDERLADLFPSGGAPRIVAEIWATVDLDRILDRFLVAEGLPSEARPDDELLGARVALVRRPSGHPIAILEPATEGRLAALLARNGEGMVGLYIEAPEALERLTDRSTESGRRFSRVASGPFGREALAELPAPGPLVVLVEASAGTIDR